MHDIRPGSLSIGVIHYGNERRLASLRPAVESLVETLRANGRTTHIREFHWQPDIPPLPRLASARRDVDFWMLHRAWHRYTGSPLPSVITLARNVAAHLLDGNASLTGERRHAIIEYVSQKHWRAWGVGLDDGSDYILTIEDDCTFGDQSIAAIEECLKGFDRVPPGIGRYRDLAGGMTREQLNLEHLVTREADGWMHFSRPVTNSAGCYLLDRPALSALFIEAMKAPRLLLQSPDWAMNGMFVSLLRSGRIMDCAHAYPTILGHGSLTGAHSSTMR